MNNSLKKQLKKYTSLSIGLVVCANNLEASVIETDVLYTGQANSIYHYLIHLEKEG